MLFRPGLVAIAVLLSSAAALAEGMEPMSPAPDSKPLPQSQSGAAVIDGCRYPGGYAAQGETVCIDVCGDRYLARCGMVLNNTAWRRVRDGCGPDDSLSSLGLPERLAHLAQPGVDPVLIHAQISRPVD